MKCKEIIVLLERTAFSGLKEDDLSGIRIHIVDCSDCDQVFQSARVSSELLHERAIAEFEPSPFFPTRVMASWRERQATGDVWAWSRLWRSAGALASSMVATVAALAVLTFVVPGSDVASGSMHANSLNGYSAEEVLFEQTAPVDEASDGQLLTSIYGGDE